MSRWPLPPEYPGEYPLIRTALPGPNARATIERDRRTVSQNLRKDVPLVVARGQGMVIEDVDGNRFLDFAAGISTVSTGHCHPDVVAAVRAQSEKLLHICYTDFFYDVYVDLCEELAAIAPITGPKRVFLTNSGAEAVETAIKLARVRTGRQKIVGFFGAFHGRTYGAMTLTASKPVQRKGYGPFVPEILHTHYAYCYRCPVNRKPESCGVECLELLTDSYFHHSVDPSEVAAVIVEPVQGEGGFIPLPDDFPAQLLELCRKHGALFVADEVQSGIGRTGPVWAIEHYGVEPDLVVSGKSLGGGLPLAGVTGPAEIMDAVEPGGLGGTFGGNPVACAAALAVLDEVDSDKFRARADELADLIGNRLREIQDKNDHCGEVRGLGPMQALELVRDSQSKEPAPDLAKATTAAAREHGLLLLSCGTYGNVIRILVPLVISDEDLSRGLDILERALGDAGA